MSGSTTTSATGLGHYSIGTERGIAYTQTTFIWSFYASRIIPVGGPNDVLADYLRKSGIGSIQDPTRLSPAPFKACAERSV